MKNKLMSRKFWISVAAMLASIGTSIAGLHSNNETIVAFGIVCAIISAAIYSFCEAWVDGKSVQANIDAQYFEDVIDEDVEE